jgi:hypothetical protein
MNKTPPRRRLERVPLRRGRTKRAPQPDLLNAVPEYLTRKQAAHIAGSTTRTVDRWLGDSDIPLVTYRNGHSDHDVLISREELRELLRVRTEQQGGEGGEGAEAVDPA